MTIEPAPDPEYQLPPPYECDEYGGSLVLAAFHEMRTRFLLWRGRHMVEFAVVQITRDGPQWSEVARIDTCHQAVHRHQLRQDINDSVGIVHELARIPAVNGWEVVDRWYQTALDLMQNDWEENLRRWVR